MTRTFASWVAALGLAWPLTTALADTAGAQESTQQSYDQLEPVVIIGEFTPPLWKASRGDHSLWILGSYRLQPVKVRWTSARLEKLIAGSNEILLPGESFVASAGISFLPDLVKAHENPAGRRLQDLMPPEAHAKWLALRKKVAPASTTADAGPAFIWDKKAKWLVQTQRYRGGDDIERLRPTLAWEGLRRAALDRNGLVSYGIESIVSDIATRHAVPVRKLPPSRERVPTRDHNAILETVALADFGDLGCLVGNLDLFEQEVAALTLRANAWARGDMEAFQQTGSTPATNDCVRDLVAAVSGGELPGSNGGKTAQERYHRARLESEGSAEKAWLKAAQTAIRKNPATFAVLPVDRLLSPDGYLAKLRALGYAVEGPS